jgi:predicted DsbA family dithiol-disulfide isomerase
MTERRFFRLADIAEKLGLDAEELRRRVADVDGFGDWLNRIEATLQALER